MTSHARRFAAILIICAACSGPAGATEPSDATPALACPGPSIGPELPPAPDRSREPIVISSPFGHDAFLIEDALVAPELARLLDA